MTSAGERFAARSLAGGPCDAAVIRSTAELPCAASTRRWVLVATILGSSLAFIDATVVNVALPVIQARLGASVREAQWIVEAYALGLSSFLLLGGALGDRLGRRRVFVLGVCLFAIASAACGLSATVSQLIVARAVQGLGGAALVPGSLALIGATFPAREKGRAIGTWSGATAVATAVGPVTGGWLVQSVSWRAVFWINVPVAAAVVLISASKIPESRREGPLPPIDIGGALLASAALAGIVFGLIESAGRALSDPRPIGAIAVGAALAVAFFAVERRTRDPMLPAAIFRSRAFAGANLVTLFLYAGLSSMMFFLPFDLIEAQHFTPAVAGAALLPMIVLIMLLSRLAGALVDRIGPRLPLTAGPALAAAGFALLAVPGVPARYWSGFFPGIALVGLGMAVTVAPLTTVVMNSVDPERSGLASGINNAVSRLGGLIAVAVLGLVVLAAFNSTLDRELTARQLASAAGRISVAERLKLGAAAIPEGLSADAARQVSGALAVAVAASFRVVALISAGLAAAAAVLGARYFRAP